MAENEEKYIGYIRYCGKLVENGLLDARKSAQALLGFDEAVRFFVGCQNRKLQEIDFELPVRIRQGSWEALIPDTVFWLKTALGVATAAYFAKAAQKMAENDFEDIGIKTIFAKFLEAIQWVIRIGKHIGTVGQKRFDSVKFRNNNTEIGIPNENGEYLWVPKFYLDLFSKCPKSILEKVADLVEDERILIIGVMKAEEEIRERITPQYKRIFAPQDEDDVLFPELVHGMEVVLEGEVTRGNETSNSIGFRYNEHILTAYPKTGSIVRYKPALFLEASIHGSINRVDETGQIKAKRPKIIFTDIVSKETESTQISLFDENA